MNNIQRKLEKLGDAQIVSFLQKFFKTGPGKYREDDLFRGIRVPVLRKLAQEYQNITLSESEQLLNSSFHEDRLLALLILVRIYSRGHDSVRVKVYDLYLRNTQFINNWDLVDSSAEHIVGAFLWDKDREPLHRLAKSSSVWERRIAIMATFHFIKHGELAETLKIARMLLTDKEDLIHKAVGWMLREVGKRNLEAEDSFLATYYRQMPRVMLRYAIEKYPASERQRYLKGEVQVYGEAGHLAVEPDAQSASFLSSKVCARRLTAALGRF